VLPVGADHQVGSRHPRRRVRHSGICRNARGHPRRRVLRIRTLWSAGM